MKKTLLALAAAATVGIAAVAAPTAANAQWRGWGHHHGFGWGAPVAAGVIGGLAAGAVIGSAFGGPYYGGYPYGAYAYDVAPVGYAAPVTYGYAAAPCALRSERFWNGYGWTIRRVRVCY